MSIVAARMAAPAAVTVVYIPAGAPTDGEPIFLLASDPIVLAYPCLPWVTHPERVGPQRVRLCHSSPPFAHSFCAIRLALTQLKHCCSFYPFLAHNYFQCSGLVSMVHGAGDERPPCLCAIRQDS